MSKRQYDEVTCDRCGFVEDRSRWTGWGKLLAHAQLRNGESYRYGVQYGELDLCPDCAASLKEWFELAGGARNHPG